MTSLFISDLHLSTERPDITQAFYEFLQTRAANADALYILGDLFDSWFGDDNPAPLVRQVIDALHTLTQGSTKLYFLHGNRDFVIGKRFARETGCTLLDEHTVITLYGQKILLLHGDTLCTDDLQYQKVRRCIRHPLFLTFANCLPLRLRQKIAAQARIKSQKTNRQKTQQIMDVSPETVKSLMSTYGVSTMIHGHTHRPMCHKVLFNNTEGQRIVLGDWDKKAWVLTASPNDALALSSFII